MVQFIGSLDVVYAFLGFVRLHFQIVCDNDPGIVASRDSNLLHPNTVRTNSETTGGKENWV